MNYAKVIGSALQLFPRKIQVTLLESGTDRLLGKCKLPAEALPLAFDRPTTLTINNVQWRVLAAAPTSADDFRYSKKLQLHVQPVNQASPDRYCWPTRCDWEPMVTDEAGTQQEVWQQGAPAFSAIGDALTIDRRDWLQWQFVPVQQREQVEEVLEHIRVILQQETNPLLGYGQQYVRTGIAATVLAIGWQDLIQQLDNPVPAPLVLETGAGVRDGFCVRSNSYTWYGTLHEGQITSLGLAGMDYVDEEIMRVMSAFELELIDWCRVSCLSAEAGEPPKNEAIDW